MVGKVLFRSVVIAAFLLTVTASHIVGKYNLFFGVDIADKRAWTVALRATVSAAGIAVRLEYKSELTHNRTVIFVFIKPFAFSALSHFDSRNGVKNRVENAKVQKVQ